MIDLFEKSKKLFVQVTSETGDVFEMSVYEYSRWLALVEAIEVIQNGADRLKIDLDVLGPDTPDWVQPIAIEKYIRERFGDILLKVMHDRELQFLCTTSPAIDLSQTLPEAEPEVEPQPIMEDQEV